MSFHKNGLQARLLFAATAISVALIHQSTIAQPTAGQNDTQKGTVESAKRMLPDAKATSPSSVDPSSGQTEVSEENTTTALDSPVAEPKLPTPSEALLEAFSPPPQAKQLSKKTLLWVDRDKKRVYIDGYVAMDRGPLEMFACPSGTKEHESVVATIARSSEVHAALLAVGAMSGTPVMFSPNFVPPTGQRIRVWVAWRDEDKKFHVVDARSWIQNVDSKQAMQADWVFAGSGFWTDPSDGKQYYRADGGDMICVSNFSTAMLDIAAASSADADALLFQPFGERIPERGTLVRLVLVPIPIPTDAPSALPSKVDANKPPSEAILPIRQAG
ncbi:YdjY domain-containing protein [Novipirellula artificiosorum]|uniref:Secreted protein n=1 Tax=Novipirellula artificiosorum TaxID=2528016 RepID=A0A5C6D1H1_9BACT|nr:YdjY domain-containing protein [Novipirellula artificiosorum]TWU31023.1 hypothetical protein Poly41_64920 [Novipirellula artificiosorum]